MNLWINIATKGKDLIEIIPFVWNMKLDKKDLRILSELDMDARQSNTQIARKCKLSKYGVGYRISKMMDGGLIEGFYTVIDISRLRYTFYRFFLRLQDTDPAREKELIRFLQASPHEAWIARTEGDYDLAVLVWAKETRQLEKFYDHLMFTFDKSIQEVEFSIASRVHHLRHKHLFGQGKSVVTGADDARYDLDEIDKKILSIIATSARIPLNDIADLAAISAKTAASRIKKLSRERIILASRAKLDVSPLGQQHFKIFLMLKNMTERRFNSLVEFLKQHPNVIYITKAVGRTNLEFEAEVGSSIELHHLMNELRHKFSDLVKNYKTCIDIKEIKIDHFPEKTV